MKILITDSQTRGAVALIRYFGKLNEYVVAADGDKISTGFFSKFTSKKLVYPDPRFDENGFIQCLLEFVKQEKIDIIFPLADETTTALAKNISLFKNLVKIPITDYKRIMQASDKSLTCKLAEKIGVPTPKTFYPETIADIEKVELFPVILKPKFSSGSRGIISCKDKTELLNKVKNISSNISDYIIQEFIPTKGKGNNEYHWYGIYDWQSNPLGYGCFLNIRSYPLNSGPPTFKASVNSEKINSLALKILKKMKWQGPAQLDFRIDSRDDTPKLLEINPRCWSSLPHSMEAGLDVPGTWYKLANNYPVQTQPPIKEGVESRWLLPGDILWFLSAPKTLQNIKDFFSFKNIHFELIDKNDLKPIIGFFLASISYLFNKEKRDFIFRDKIED